MPSSFMKHLLFGWVKNFVAKQIMNHMKHWLFGFTFHNKLVQDAIAVAISAPARPAIVAFAAAFSTAFAKARILKASGRP